MSEIKYITQSTVLQRGWTKSLIDKYLPAPKEVRNPHYRCAAPMKLWELLDVENAEKREDFNSDLARIRQRKNNSAKAVETKKRKLKEAMEEAAKNAYVILLDDKELRKEAIDQQQYWYDLHFDWRHERSTEWADEETIQRWVVNYIRHNLVNYDSMLFSNKGKTGKDDVYPIFKKLILTKIADAYPNYADECSRQIEDLEQEYYYCFETGMIDNDR